MNTKFVKCLLVALVFISIGAHAQPTENWDSEKIIGQRYYLNARYQGSPYLFDGWQKGTIRFTSGQELSGVMLKYDGYKDELVYINELYQAMIQVEKPAVESFSFNDQGKEYYFERRYFDGMGMGERYFQVLHKGNVDLLCLRKIELIGTSVYKDANGVAKNMEYVQSFRYFLAKKEGGYQATSLRKKSLLKYFTGAQKKRVTQLMRTNHIRFKTEEGFARALSILENNNIKLDFIQQ